MALRTAGVGAFVGTLASKVLERLLAQHATRYIDRLVSGKQAAERHRAERHDAGTAILVALGGARGPVPINTLVARHDSEVLTTVDAVHKLRRARLLKYADGRRAVQLTQHGRELLANLFGDGGEGADAHDVSGAARAGRARDADPDGDDGATSPETAPAGAED